MTVALVSDAHLISPADEHDRRAEREKFVEAWPSFRRMIDRLNDEAVDHVVVLGDLVDYYSEANRDFALGLLSELDAPWALTPGNHDLQVHPPPGEETTDRDEDWAREGWTAAGVDLSNRVFDIGETRFLLLDSSASEVPAGSGAWLDANLDGDRDCVVCTHVPIDTPAVVDSITSVDPDRDLEKYVQRGSPDLFDRHLRGRADAVFSGHLHFPAGAGVDGTRQHILPPCVHVSPPYTRQGSAYLLDPDEPGTFRRLRTESERD